jgi:hypothetical protein
VANNLPTEVEKFILNYIDSVEQLEILLLLSASLEKSWTVEQLNARIQSSPASVIQRLEGLVSRGLLAVSTTDPVTYQFRPANPDLVAAVEALATTYKERRLKVLECLFSKPQSSLRIFADSFKLKGPS